MYIALLNGKWRLLPLDISPQSHDGYRKHSDIYTLIAIYVYGLWSQPLIFYNAVIV